MANFRIIALLILISFVLVFTLQNIKIVEIQLLFWQFAMPRSLLIFMMLMIGFLIGWFTKVVKSPSKERSKNEERL